MKQFTMSLVAFNIVEQPISLGWDVFSVLSKANNNLVKRQT